MPIIRERGAGEQVAGSGKRPRSESPPPRRRGSSESTSTPPGAVAPPEPGLLHPKQRMKRAAAAVTAAEQDAAPAAAAAAVPVNWQHERSVLVAGAKRLWGALQESRAALARQSAAGAAGAREQQLRGRIDALGAELARERAARQEAERRNHSLLEQVGRIAALAIAPAPAPAPGAPTLPVAGAAPDAGRPPRPAGVPPNRLPPRPLPDPPSRLLARPAPVPTGLSPQRLPEAAVPPSGRTAPAPRPTDDGAPRGQPTPATPARQAATARAEGPRLSRDVLLRRITRGDPVANYHSVAALLQLDHAEVWSQVVRAHPPRASEPAAIRVERCRAFYAALPPDAVDPYFPRMGSDSLRLFGTVFRSPVARAALDV